MTVNAATYTTPVPFSCGVSTVQDADGNTYSTLSIGSQCWMQQNLRIGTRIDRSTLQSDNDIIEKYCYDDTDSNCITDNPNYPDGGLYQWDEAMQYTTVEGGQGICPSGWHIPTHDEFTTLERTICTAGSCITDFPYDTTTIGSRGTDEGTKLKSDGTSGFEANLAGYSDVEESFFSRTSIGILWSSSERDVSAWNRYVSLGSGQVVRSADDKTGGVSVRCLKN